MDKHELLTDLEWWLRGRLEVLQKEMDFPDLNEQGRSNVWSRMSEVAKVREKLKELANRVD